MGNRDYKLEKELNRDSKGRFSSFWKQVKNLLRITFWLGMACLTLFLTYKAGQYNETVVIQKVEAEVQDTLKEKVNQLKSEVLDTLKSCESGGYSEDDGIIIFDSNNQASIGSYQFQKKTVIHYYQTLYGKTITPKEAVIIALDEEEARKLANDVIFQDSKGISNWFNCSKKHNLKAKVDIIKELEQ